MGLLYSRSETRDVEKWNVRESRLKQALLRSDATAFNPFGYTFRVANNMRRSIEPSPIRRASWTPLRGFLREGATEVADLGREDHGPLLQLADSDPLRGRNEARYETYSDWRPPFHGLNPADSGLPRATTTTSSA